MSKIAAIICNECEFIIKLDDPKAGELIRCPECGTYHLLTDNEDKSIEDKLSEYNQYVYIDTVLEMDEIRREVESLDDESLIEEITPLFLNKKYSLPPGSEEVVVEWGLTGKLTKESRKKAEGVYILFHTDYMLEE